MFIDLFLELLGLIGVLVLICVLICIVSIMILFFKAVHEVFKAAKQVDKNKNKQEKEEKEPVASLFIATMLKAMDEYDIQEIIINRPSVVRGYQFTVKGKEKYECLMIDSEDVNVSRLSDDTVWAALCNLIKRVSDKEEE